MNPPAMVSGGWPIIGHGFELLRDRNALFKRGYAEHGKMFSLKVGGKRAVVLTGPEYNRFVFKETDGRLNVQEGYEFIRPAFGDNFFIVSHEEYLNMRPVLQEIFKSQRMVGYVDSMSKEVQLWLDSLGEEGETDIAKDMLTLTQYVVGRAFIGDNFREELGEDFWLQYEAISKALDFILPPYLPIPKFIRRDRARAKMIKVLEEVIQERRKAPDDYDDVLATLLKVPRKDGSYMSNQQMIDFFSGLLFAGHETTAGQAAWTIAELLQHPGYLEVVQQEIDEELVYGEPINGTRLRQTPHIFYAIKEVTRMHPSAELLFRTANEDIELDGCVIPKGSMVFLNAVNSHNLTDIWDHPEAFDPYHWAPENKHQIDSRAIMGFGGGMHKCTGMNFANNEMAVIVGLLFQQFEVTLLSEKIEVVGGPAAPHPTEVRVQYRRKPL